MCIFPIDLPLRGGSGRQPSDAGCIRRKGRPPRHGQRTQQEGQTEQGLLGCQTSHVVGIHNNLPLAGQTRDESSQ